MSTATLASSKAEGSAKDPPTKTVFGRSGFSRDLASSKTKVQGCRDSLHQDPLRPRRQGSGLKPLLQKSSFGRSGFRRDHCVIESQGFGVVRVVSVVTLASSKAEGSGRKILLQKPSFVGAAFAATLASSKTEVQGCRDGLHQDPLRPRRQGSGLKPLLQKSSFCRSGFRRDLLRLWSRRIVRG